MYLHKVRVLVCVAEVFVDCGDAIVCLKSVCVGVDCFESESARIPAYIVRVAKMPFPCASRAF